MISKIEDYNIYRWKEGLYCFKNQIVIEIIKDLEKYYNLKIIVDKPSITNIILTGNSESLTAWITPFGYYKRMYLLFITNIQQMTSFI